MLYHYVLPGAARRYRFSANRVFLTPLIRLHDSAGPVVDGGRVVAAIGGGVETFSSSPKYPLHDCTITIRFENKFNSYIKTYKTKLYVIVL